MSEEEVEAWCLALLDAHWISICLRFQSSQSKSALFNGIAWVGDGPVGTCRFVFRDHSYGSGLGLPASAVKMRLVEETVTADSRLPTKPW